MLASKTPDLLALALLPLAAGTDVLLGRARTRVDQLAANLAFDRWPGGSGRGTRACANLPHVDDRAAHLDADTKANASCGRVNRALARLPGALIRGQGYETPKNAVTLKAC